MKKNFLPFVLLVMALGFVSCNRQKQANAIIFERKEIDSGQLMIKYSYSYNDVNYIDSATINSKVVVGDSIVVGVTVDSPEKSIPMLNN